MNILHSSLASAAGQELPPAPLADQVEEYMKQSELQLFQVGIVHVCCVCFGVPGFLQAIDWGTVDLWADAAA